MHQARITIEGKERAGKMHGHPPIQRVANERQAGPKGVVLPSAFLWDGLGEVVGLVGRQVVELTGWQVGVWLLRVLGWHWL